MDTDADFLVRYAEGGRRFLLQWWTHNEQGHLLVGRTPAQVEAMLARVFVEHPQAEVRAYVEAELVAPTARMHAVQAATQRRQRVQSFWIHVRALAKEHLELRGDYPPGIEACPEFVPREPPDSTDADDQWSRERHYDCVNCQDRLRLVGMTPDELYDRHGAEYAARERARDLKYPVKAPRPRPVRSRAPEAGDLERVWAAVAQHGDHDKGTVLAELDDPATWDTHRGEDWVPWFNGTPVLFLFRKLGDLNLAPFAAQAKAAWSAVVTARAAREKEGEARAEREARARVAELRRWLGCAD